MIATIHQPNFIPYLGVFYKVYHSDVFVLLDDAQYSNEAMHNWNTIKTSNGTTRLKIPVVQHLGDKICEVDINNGVKWKEKHLKTIECNYKKAPYFSEYFEQIKTFYDEAGDNLSEFTEKVLVWAVEGFFGSDKSIAKSKELGISTVREQRILDITKAVGCDTYYSGTGARVYQDEGSFRRAGIDLVYSDYEPKEYRQLWGAEFVPNLSVLDYVFNCGFDKKIFE